MKEFSVYIDLPFLRCLHTHYTPILDKTVEWDTYIEGIIWIVSFAEYKLLLVSQLNVYMLEQIDV